MNRLLASIAFPDEEAGSGAERPRARPAQAGAAAVGLRGKTMARLLDDTNRDREPATPHL